MLEKPVPVGLRQHLFPCTRGAERKEKKLVCLVVRIGESGWEGRYGVAVNV